MAGGWVGYVYALLACGGVVLLLATSTLVLYGVARIRPRGPDRVRVTSVVQRDRSDAA